MISSYHEDVPSRILLWSYNIVRNDVDQLEISVHVIKNSTREINPYEKPWNHGESTQSLIHLAFQNVLIPTYDVSDAKYFDGGRKLCVNWMFSHWSSAGRGVVVWKIGLLRRNGTESATRFCKWGTSNNGKVRRSAEKRMDLEFASRSQKLSAKLCRAIFMDQQTCDHLCMHRKVGSSLKILWNSSMMKIGKKIARKISENVSLSIRTAALRVSED